MKPIGTPAVHSRLGGDLYLSLIQVDKQGADASVRAMYTPGVSFLWGGVFVMAFGALIAAWPTRRRRAEARVERKSA